jgi:DNA-binding beta-propeller fold protein YncE
MFESVPDAGTFVSTTARARLLAPARRDVAGGCSVAGRLLLLLLPAVAAIFAGCGPTEAPAPEKPTRFVFWPKPPDEPRVQFLTAFSKASDVRINSEAGNKLKDFLYGKEAEQDLPIVKPYGVAFWDGRIYVTDLRGTGIMVLDLKKKQTRVMGATGEGALKHAVDLCVGPDGTKFVADMQLNAVMVFDAGERFTKSFTSADLNPVGVAIHGNDLYVADYNARLVKVLDATTGKLRRTIGTPGVGGEDNQFVRPLAVSVDAAGNVYVVDVLKCRVQKFSPSGELLLGFGQTGNRAGDFVRPKHMGVASDGTLFITDAAFNNVQVFDEQGLVVGFFGGGGDYPGAMDLPAGLALVENPADIALFAGYLNPDFVAERLAIVSNQFGPNKVAIYAVGHLKPGRSVADLNASRIEIKEAPADSDLSNTGGTTRPATRPVDSGTP